MKLLNCLGWAGCLTVAMVSHSADCMAQTRLWGTYYGGEAKDVGSKIAVDAASNVYIVGTTTSMTGIATPGAFDLHFDQTSEAFLAKFDGDGHLLWSTYFGGGGSKGKDLGLDAAGNIYIVGDVHCPSTTLATAGAHDLSCSGLNDAFVAKFDQNGKRIWATYYGGEGQDFAYTLSVTRTGHAYIGGHTNSSTGIASAGSSDGTLGGWADGFIAAFDPVGKMQWARYYGGEKTDVVYDIACYDASAPWCFVVGDTTSANDVSTSGAHDVLLNGGSDAFIAKIDGAGGNVWWATYYGGAGSDHAYTVAVDRSLNAYVGGCTTSADSMATPNANDATFGGFCDGFLARFNPAGVRQAGTYYGSSASDDDWVEDLATDSDNNLYAIARVGPSGGAPTQSGYDETFNGISDAYFAKFNQVLVLLRSSYYGGNGAEIDLFAGPSRAGIAVDGEKQVYVSGNTDSGNAIATPGAHKTSPDGLDAFVAKFAP